MSEHEHAACGCREYHELSRRNFIVGTAGATVFGAILPAWLPKVVLARSEVSSRDIIVNIFQRGGADGLSLVAPFADANYYTARPALAIPRPDSGDANRGTALDNTFQFPRPMLGLLPAYQAGELLCVHGAGLAYSSRSHFDAQRFIEVGKAADLTITTGWLGRHLATTEAMRPGATLRGLAMSSGLPTDLTGGPKTLPIPDPATYAIGGSATTRAARAHRLPPHLFPPPDPARPPALADWLATDFFLDQEPARSSALDATATLALLRSINFTGYAPSNGAVYPNNGFGRSLRSAAALIKADIGVEEEI